MNPVARWILVSLAVGLIGGCGCKRDPASPAATTDPARSSSLDGEIHVAGQRKRVAPFVIHEPGLDLRVQCLARRDGLAEEGKEISLCFDETERKVDEAVTTVRLEHHEGMRIAETLHLLRVDEAAAHFAVDDGGTPYQLLDLALAARRDGAYRPAEVRILSGSADGHERLLKALRTHYPDWPVETVQIARPRPPEKSGTAPPTAPPTLPPPPPAASPEPPPPGTPQEP